MHHNRYARLGATLRALLSILAAAAVAFLLGRMVGATPGGQTRDALSFAGTLRLNGQPVMGAQLLTFAFKKGGATVCSPTAMATPDAQSGAFSVEIQLAGCPATLLDGGDVTFDVSVGNTLVAASQSVNAVPYAKYADRVGSPDCPVGWARDQMLMGVVLCRKGTDEMVRVGTGPTAFWIDRYEASLWQNADGTGNQYGLADGDAHGFGFSRNGQYSKPLYAVSRSGAAPAGWLTWFQAQAACRASGKRLPTNEEWLEAGRGTADPGASAGNGGLCFTQGNAPRTTGAGTQCVSQWGAQDLVGNQAEPMGEWAIGVGQTSGVAIPWPAEYNGDGTNNVSSWADSNGLGKGIVAALLRGGDWGSAAAAGLFNVNVNSSPAGRYAQVGVRCVIGQ